MDQKEQDEFDRIELHQDIERAREMITQYEKGMGFYRQVIEARRYWIGRLDERLGEGS
jgi:hypothetical protein